jgi:hypothetical protein
LVENVMMTGKTELQVAFITVLLCCSSLLFAGKEDTLGRRQLYLNHLDTSDSLDVQAGTVQVIEEEGQKALELEGMVLIPDLEIEDAGIKVEILAPGPCYPGIVFRSTDVHSFELAYAVPEVSDQFDAIQYDPVFNGSNTWQLHTGPAYQKRAVVPTGVWFTLRIDVMGERAAIQVGDQPPLVVEHLSHGKTSGRIGLWTYLPARFRNLRVTSPRSFEDLSGENPEIPDGVIDAWFLQGTGSITCEPSGVLNLNRYMMVADAEARLTRQFIVDDETDLELKFGYSDELKLSLDGELLFEGTHVFSGFENLETRGWVQPGSTLPLKHISAGRHELEAVLRVTEPFGWGLIVGLEGGGVRLLPVTNEPRG